MMAMIGERDDDCEEMVGGAAADSNARRVDWLGLEQQQEVLPADSPKIRQRSHRRVEEQLQQRCQRGIGHASSLYFFDGGLLCLYTTHGGYCCRLLVRGAVVERASYEGAVRCARRQGWLNRS